MKTLIAFLVLTTSVSSFAQGFQTPMQMTANVGKAVISHLTSSPDLEMLRIERISVSGKYAKAQLLDSEGSCSAIPFIVQSDARGKVSVKLNTTAFAVCD